MSFEFSYCYRSLYISFSCFVCVLLILFAFGNLQELAFLWIYDLIGTLIKPGHRDGGDLAL